MLSTACVSNIALLKPGLKSVPLPLSYGLRNIIPFTRHNLLVIASQAPARTRRLRARAGHIVSAADIRPVLEVVHRIAEVQTLVERWQDQGG